ncbi:MAG: 2-oxoglutarate synthase [Candidatus Magasanikbacteria bacterium GW2011_GWC2_34_16]|uniref:2-oxoglutarate synthase n=2 Tax=Candidatus Magasanikiibacteriota TaxID=1752731 RepID=A0A0G0HB43_9BACT|nr:MAG: 2-oxoglutarate synthase [Candidatus Magasanikbacteria bacterium GW2011_GWC2_34_16]KKQ40498.1 MAG: 2-oxoglutarate synthase [Candidatus Magasanikbacteria bacterium GW2011_GWA2_37_8]
MAENLAKFCAGCGYPITLMMLNKTLEKLDLQKRAVLGLDIGCALLAWNFLPINTFQTHHGRVAPTMMGFKRARNNSICFALVGDGGAYAIGLQSLIHAAKRDEPITVIVANNTVYGMTGGQTAPTTLCGQVTPTSPKGNIEEPFHGPEMLKGVIKDGAFLARTAVNEPKQLQEFLQKAIETQQAGHFSLVEVLSFCPTNWKTNGVDTINKLNGLKDIFELGIL